MSRWKKEEVSDNTLNMREWSQTPQGLEYKKRHREYMKEWRRKNPDKRRVIQQKSYAAIRQECFEAYGGAKCRCCGEKEIKFLHLDHKNGDGSKIRRQIKEETGQTLNGGTSVMYWLKKQGWPDNIQILCANCNLGKRTGQYCPHELKRGVDMNGNPIVMTAVA